MGGDIILYITLNYIKIVAYSNLSKQLRFCKFLEVLQISNALALGKGNGK